MKPCFRVPLTLLVLILQSCRVANGKCQDAVRTVVKVESCPTNKQEWENSATLKNCNITAARQSCTDADKFVYHCVINGFQNETLEVCAPNKFIAGYCTEFNVDGGVIQAHPFAPCNNDHFPNCTEVYHSSEAYKYQGCYEIVYRKRTSTSEKETNRTILIVLITVAAVVCCTVIAITVILCRRHKACVRRGKGEDVVKDSEEQMNLIQRTGDNDHGPSKDISTSADDTEEDQECSIEEFKEEMEKAELLRVTVAVEDEDMAANFNRKRDDADSFLQAYEAVLICFEKTGLLKKCQHSLNKNGITILSGQQGSGKTLSAVYIMTKSKRYEQWTKLKFTSWVDLLTIELEAKTLVYIDNLFDGYMYMYMYPEELRKWWHSLCYFYFKQIRSKKDIHLLITVKDDVMKEACEQIKTNVDEKPFYLKADQFPLTDEERKKILESQFKLAKELKNIDNPEIASTYADIKEKDKSCAIGFPLCAHLYAFERKAVYKTKSIFSDPVSYVIHHFQREIEEDKTSSVKTLFLLLLFYTNPNRSKQSRRLDLRYAKDIREYVEEVVPENLAKEMEPLNFENLPTKAKLLEYTILIKQSSMFEFKHQIYLDGASDYFLRKSPEVAVDNFPLTIIRSYAFPDASKIVWSNLVRRFERELEKNINIQDSNMDIESCKNMIPEVLSCKIFDKEQFEIEFKKELEKGGVLYRLLLSKRLCFAFWASRFGRRHLSATAFNLVEHSDYQFYLEL